MFSPKICRYAVIRCFRRQETSCSTRCRVSRKTKTGDNVVAALSQHLEHSRRWSEEQQHAELEIGPTGKRNRRFQQRTNFEVRGKLKKGGHHRRIDVDGRTKVAGATFASNQSKRNLARGANSGKKRTKNEGSRIPEL